MRCGNGHDADAARAGLFESALTLRFRAAGMLHGNARADSGAMCGSTHRPCRGFPIIGTSRRPHCAVCRHRT
ncbi:hypothetical protein EMIT0111MI5_10509 [Burkholderia sp. IT-111MI5]